MMHPDRCPKLTSEQLTEVIPDFKWTGGHSGVVLTSEQAEKLEELWAEYKEKNAEFFVPRAVTREW